MSNDLSSEMVAQLFAQSSNDPLLTLVTLNHSSFVTPIRLVNNTEAIVSRGNTFLGFPMKITLAPDDGEQAREVQIEFDNVSLYLVDALRSVDATPIEVFVEMILASIPNEVQISVEELKIRQIQYNRQKITARLYMDDFLNTAVTSEKYSPTNFPGLF